jgi:hypothetical protein
MVRSVKSLPKKTLWLLLVLVLVAGALTVPIAAWAAEPSAPLAAAAAPLDSSAPADRAQFAMLAVIGFGLSTSSPATPTFVDVPRGSLYYQYIEGAYASGLVRGLGGGYYGPDMHIARQQVATILARYLSAMELRAFGFIQGEHATYATLAGWFEAEGAEQLAAFGDSLSISAVHRAGVAYLAMHGIALGSNGWFNPLSSVTVGQCVSFISRAAEVAKSFTTPVVVPPTVTSVAPATGSYLGGTTVQITGTGFTAGATVRFGTAAAASVTVSSSTLIVAVSPAGTAGSTVQVSVTTASGTSANTSADDFTYASWAAPVITALSANYGRPGDTINIYGANFTTDGLQVWFDGRQVTPANIAFVNSTRLTVVVPYGDPGFTVRVKVVTAYGVSADTSADNFTYYYVSSPTITDIVPDHGWQGDVVHVYGTNFVPGDTAVYFGDQPANLNGIDFYGSTHLSVVVPPGVDGTTVRVRVVTDYGTSPNTAADEFTYDLSDDPIVSDVVPDHGWINDVVNIYGHNFTTTGLRVWFGSVELLPAQITYVNSTRLLVVVPAGYSDGQTVRVTVTTVFGTSANTAADDFTYMAPQLVISGIDDAEYSVAGADVWQSAPSALWTNGTLVDFRVRVVDQYGDPVTWTDVARYSPLCSWVKIAPVTALQTHIRLTGHRAPVTSVTDADGYLYWTNLGGFSDSTYDFMLGLGVGWELGHPSPGPGLGSATFEFVWAP